jgi:hypothetical protein
MAERRRQHRIGGQQREIMEISGAVVNGEKPVSAASALTNQRRLWKKSKKRRDLKRWRRRENGGSGDSVKACRSVAKWLSAALKRRKRKRRNAIAQAAEWHQAYGGVSNRRRKMAAAAAISQASKMSRKMAIGGIAWRQWRK